MPTLLLSMVLLLVASTEGLFGSAIVPGSMSTYDALVVISIEGFDDAAMQRLAEQVGRSKDVGLEYGCVWSGVAVLKFTGLSVSERADVITFARRLLASAGIERGVEFLKVHVVASGPGKC